MKLQAVQTSQVFRSKFLEKSQLADAQVILRKMTAKNTTQENEYKYSRRFLDTLEIGEDKALYMGLTDKTDGRSILRLGKTKLEFDNKTGEIISYKKPLFNRWSKIMENVSVFFKHVKGKL